MFFSIYARNFKTVIQQDPVGLKSDSGVVYNGSPGIEVPYLYNKRRELSKKTDKTIGDEILLRLLKKHDGHELISKFDLKFVMWLFVIPAIVIYPLIKTIIDLCTRKPLDTGDLDKLNNALDNLFQSETGFDDFVEKMIMTSGSFSFQTNYQSSESQLLITELRNIKDEATKFMPLIHVLEKCFLETYPDATDSDRQRNLDTFCSTLTMHHIFKRVGRKQLYETIIPLYDALPEKQKNVFCNKKNETQHPVEPSWQRQRCGSYYYELEDYEIIDKDYRQKQLSAIKAYIRNPDNNGKKLMQYIQTNISPEMRGEYRENTLRKKAEAEINRLEKSFSCNAPQKASKIKEALEKAPFDEKKLFAALMTSRGFWRIIPQACTNVYYTSAPCNTA